MRITAAISALLMSSLLCSPVYAEDAANTYTITNLVANKPKYKPTLHVDRTMINAWGLSNRPAGAGGHFWVTAKDTSIEYVGDVQTSSDAKLQTLFQDELKIVKLPVGGKDKFATGTVFNDSKDNFEIAQQVEGFEAFVHPAKFLFASDGGLISAWTEHKKLDGSFVRPGEAIVVVDASEDGAQFFGLAISHDYDRLYAANFGVNPDIQVFNGKFKDDDVTFDMPFDDNKNGKVDPGEYAPFNIQALTTPGGDHHVFVAYAKTQACPKAEIKKGTCKRDELFAGEEDTSKPGMGRLAEFTEDGKLVAVWDDGGHLSAPWGLSFAPAGFGALSGQLLVSNFGDGTIAAFDPQTRRFTDVMRNAKGKPVVIDKIWGLMFGNGASLGDSTALYFAAGPNDEKDGIFGSLRVAKQ